MGRYTGTASVSAGYSRGHAHRASGLFDHECSRVGRGLWLAVDLSRKVLVNHYLSAAVAVAIVLDWTQG
jgi:hypothetical protein